MYDIAVHISKAFSRYIGSKFIHLLFFKRSDTFVTKVRYIWNIFHIIFCTETFTAAADNIMCRGL